MNKTLNKVTSLPRIGTQRHELSKIATSRQLKNSIQMPYNSVIESTRDKKIQNEEQKVKIATKRPIVPMKRVKTQFFKKSTQENEENGKEKKFGLKQNGKLNKILQMSSSESKVLDTQRSVKSTTKPESEQKEKISAIKNQLNEVISSVLILKKQIKAIEGSTLQLKQQRKGMTITQSANESNEKNEQKIEQIKTMTEWSKYEQQVLKNMKDRLKQVNLNFEKKNLELRATLLREEKKVKILNQRTSIRQESINKKKHLIKTVQQKEKNTNILIVLETSEHQKRLKQLNEQKELALKGYKSISSDEYHYQEYKKKQSFLFEQIRANDFVRLLLDSKWNQYSEKYAEVQKAQKLMQMYQIIKIEGEFDPLKTYFDSFENKAKLETKIKENEAWLASCMTINKKLNKQWQQVGFNQTSEEQKKANAKPLEIKTGKITQQSQQEKIKREKMVELRRKKEVAKEKSEKYNEIMNWVNRLEKIMQLNAMSNKDLDVRLQQIIKKTVEEQKSEQKIRQQEEKSFQRVFEGKKAGKSE